MDEMDKKIVRELEQNSRVSNTELATKLNVSEGTIRKRINKLVKTKEIKRFTVELSARAGFTGFILVKTDPQKASDTLVSEIREIEGVKKVFEMAGAVDAMVKITTSNADSFNNVVDTIRKHPCVKETESMIVLKSL